MFTDAFDKNALAEIGLSLSEIYGVPLIIADLTGTPIFISSVWHYRIDMEINSFIKYLIRMFTISDNSTDIFMWDNRIAVVSVKSHEEHYAFGIVDLHQKISLSSAERTSFINSLKRTIGDISLYGRWATKRQLKQPSTANEQALQRFQRGVTTEEEIIRGYLKELITNTGFDTVVLLFLDGNSQTLDVGYVEGDHRLSSNCLLTCGLGWWSIHAQGSVQVSQPDRDARCRAGGTPCGAQIVGCWPLYMQDEKYGILYLLNKGEKQLEQWQQHFVDRVAQQVSFVLAISSNVLQRADSSRKLGAINELCQLLTSSLDLEVVLKLMVDLLIHTFDISKCTLVLLDMEIQLPNLMVSRAVDNNEALYEMDGVGGVGARPEEVEFLVFPIRLSGEQLGHIYIAKFPKNITEEDKEIISTFTNMIAIAIKNQCMYEKAQKTVLESIRVLTLAIETRDKTVFGHSKRVSELAVALAKEMGLDKAQVFNLEVAGLLHDIGKLGISEAKLNITGFWNSDDYEEIKRHPIIGSEMLTGVSAFTEIIPIIRFHHERFDGLGYPEGLAGEDIPLCARILAIADTFEALTSKRTYRDVKSPLEALHIIKENAGLQFDNNLMSAFDSVIMKSYINGFTESQSEQLLDSTDCRARGNCPLTQRELEITGYIAKGYSNKEIAEILFLSEKTVKTHVTRILRKLQLSDRTKVAIYAIQTGLTS